MPHFTLKIGILILDSSLILWIKTDDTFRILLIVKLRHKGLTDMPNNSQWGRNLD